MITAEEERMLREISAEPVKVFLQTAILSKTKGDSYNYNHIVHQLRIRDDQDMVATVYVGLSSCVSQFTPRPDLFRDLMQSVFSYDWNCNMKVTVAYVNLLGHILSANVTYLVPAYNSLIASLVRFSEHETHDAQLIELREEASMRIHQMIQQIAILIPTGITELFPILRQHFPHKRFSQKILTEYVTHLLKICSYFPIIQNKILDLIIEKCLEIDVEIVIEDSGEIKISEEFHGEIGDDMFAIDENNNTTNNSNYNDNNNQLSNRIYTEGSQYIPTEVVELADKLDAMLCLLIEFIEDEIQENEINITNNNSNNISTNTIYNNNENRNKKINKINNIDKLSDQLMVLFEDRILMTHRSKFVQFLLFYFASKVVNFSENFARRMVRIFVDESVTQIKRQSAILYLASYTVRANFLKISVVSSILTDLLTWAETYVQTTGTKYLPISVITPTNSLSNINLNNSQKSKGSGQVLTFGSFHHTDQNYMTEDEEEEEAEVDEYGRAQTTIVSAVMRHETFFSCVQAACYILCFHGMEIANVQKKSKSMQKKWQTVLTCTLHPLRFCLQSVRVEFIRLAQQSNMLDESCWEALSGDILLDSRGDDASRRKNNISMGAGSNPLDSFFPYDPCLLRMLHQSIEINYRSWKGVPGLDDVIDVDVDVACPTDLIASVPTDCLNDRNHQSDVVVDDDLEEITRSRESSICSDSSSECSQSMSSSATPFGGSNESGMRSSTHSQSHSVNVSMSISMTESVGMGLLEEREVEKRERDEKGSERYLDSRAQSMVSDCSLEDDQNNLTVVRSAHSYSQSYSQPQSQSQSQSQSQIYSSSASNNTLISFAQFGAMVGKTESSLGAGNIGGIGAMIDNGVRNKENRDTHEKHENDCDNEGNLSTRLSANNITQLADKTGWAKPDRRPRQYSVGSTGSW